MIRPTSAARQSATALCLLACVATGFRAAPAAAQDSAAPSRRSQADAILDWALKTGPYPGVSVAIEQHGAVVYRKGAGYADLEKKVPVTPDIRFPVGSITKSFTCLSTLQLVAKGDVDLDRVAGDYLPDLPAPDRGVKLRFLMNHTSGIPNYTDLPDFPAVPPKGMTGKQVEDMFTAQPLLFTSGASFNYSNSDTFLLGLIVAKVSGLPYDKYVETHVLEPFGMTRSGFDAHDDGAADRARGYQLTKDGFRPSTPYEYAVPFSAGALVSTPGDLLKYRRGVFGPKTSPAVRDLVLTRVAMSDGTPNPYALGCLIVTNMEGHRKITHAGDIYGFAADYAYYPDDDLTIAITANNQGAKFPPISIERKLARVFLGLPAPDILDRPVSAEVGQRLAGDYKVGDFKLGFDKIGLVFKDGVLNLSIGGVGSGAPLTPLRYQGDGRFVSSADDESAIQFKAEADGGESLVLHFYEGAIPAKKVG
jgi:D-alanyl-D-alanine carboxypeptidase